MNHDLVAAREAEEIIELLTLCQQAAVRKGWPGTAGTRNIFPR